MSGQAGVLVERKIMVEEDGVEGRREAVLQIGHPQWTRAATTRSARSRSGG
jgi:hypothetical protein